ncbi:unnamed protein product [Caenorhabditis nigoni]
MPHLVMAQILDNVDFLTIQNLRRVCKSFRNFIDDVKPINNLKIIRIYVEHRRIKVKLVFDFEETFISCFLFYQEGPKDNTCRIFRDSGEPEFVVKKDGHFVDAFLTDFEPILKNQRSKLSELEIKVNSFNYCDEKDILIMKEAFLTNPRLKNWEVTFQKIEDHGLIYEVLGRIPNGQSVEWFYEISNSQEILRIYEKSRSNWVFTTIGFTRIDLADVPKNALIL